MQIAQELQLEVKRSTCRRSVIEVYKPLPMDPSGQHEIRRLEIERELRLKELEAQAQQRKEKLEAQQRKDELEAQQQKEELALKHEKEMRALELNTHRITHEESISIKFDLGKNV